MNASPARTIRKFNPGIFQSDDEVIGQFSVRRRQLGIVLEVLRGNVGAPSCQHVLLVAPRGRGKTMLLARVAAELRTSRELSEHLLPVRFMEESQEVLDMGDFWLETLFHLAREIGKNDPEIARELGGTHADLAARWRGKELEERARAAALDATDRLGKQIVLMVENLQTLCGHVDDDFGWKLRKALQSEPRIVLLATATSHFKGLDDAREPFFELFRIVRLDPLDTEECRCLWRAVSGGTVSEREIRPLEILTGGNPRLLVIVAGFARHRSMNQLMENLVELIDDHTEYFRSHLEGFAKTERRVYLSVIDLWQPSSTGEIAARARMDVRTVSTLLGRLVNRGAVVVEGSGKKRLYAAAERLYSIYYKLRRERDEAAVVQNLILFLVVFYTEDEMTEMFMQLNSEAKQSSIIREGIDRAVAINPKIGRFLPSKVSPYMERKSKQSTPYDEVGERFGDSDIPELQKRVAKAPFNKDVIRGQLGEAEAEIAVYDEIVERFGDSDTPELQELVAMALVNKGRVQIDLDYMEEAWKTSEELEKKYSALIDDNGITFAWRARWIKMKVFIAQGRRPESMETFRSVYATFVPGNRAMMRQMLDHMIDSIAVGASEGDLVDILSSDGKKSDALEPFNVALRQRIGETVRAPIEVLEIAQDIRQRIEEVERAGGTTISGRTK